LRGHGAEAVRDVAPFHYPSYTYSIKPNLKFNTSDESLFSVYLQESEYNPIVFIIMNSCGPLGIYVGNSTISEAV
jgi:hypothetical protein